MVMSSRRSDVLRRLNEIRSQARLSAMVSGCDCSAWTPKYCGAATARTILLYAYFLPDPTLRLRSNMQGTFGSQCNSISPRLFVVMVATTVPPPLFSEP